MNNSLGSLAPIVLFVYNRIEHTRLTVESLLRNKYAEFSDLIIFSDAAYSFDKKSGVEDVRKYLESIIGFRSITIYHRSENFGLARSIIEGVTQILSEHQKIIVLEDDMVTAPHFLAYMNEALLKYADDDRVISIHAYVYPVKGALPETFFLRGADCWGWATWRRGWSLFNPDGQFLLDGLTRKKLIFDFNFKNTYPFSKMLEGQIKGLNDSWAIRWYASAFLAAKLTLYPARSLLHNIGNDASGTHCIKINTYDNSLSLSPIDLQDIKVESSEDARHLFEDFFRQTQSGLMSKIRNFFHIILGEI